MISGLRDYTLALACQRHGLSTAHGRGFDSLPSDVHSRLEEAFVRKLELSELGRVLGVATSALVAEIRITNMELSEQLGPILSELDPFVG